MRGLGRLHCAGLAALRQHLVAFGDAKLVEVLLRTLNTEGGAVHAVLQVADLGSASSTRGVG